MRIITGKKGEPHVTSEEAGAINAGSFGIDLAIMPVWDEAAAELVSNNEIRIKSGVVVWQGRAAVIDRGTYDSFTIENATAGRNRFDVIYLHYTKSGTGEEEITLEYAEGEERQDAVPTYPDLPGSGTIIDGSTEVSRVLYYIDIINTGYTPGVTVKDNNAKKYKDITAKISRDLGSFENAYITIPGGQGGGRIIIDGAGTNDKGFYIYHKNAAGTYSVKAVLAATDVDVTPSSGQMTILNGTARRIFVTVESDYGQIAVLS